MMPEEKTEWKKCPKCEGWIPKHWREHKFNKKQGKECGWSEEPVEEDEKASFDGDYIVPDLIEQKRQDIARAVALKAAVELLAKWEPKKDWNAVSVTQVADELFKWLLKGAKP